MIRIPNGKPAHGASFYDERDSLPESSPSVTTHEHYYLDKLREQNEAEKRLVYFDIETGYDNHSAGLEEFQSQYDDDQADEFTWHSAVATI